MPATRKPSTRLYVDASLHGSSLRLAEAQAHYLGRVLRCRQGDRIVVFNARGDERIATVRSLAKSRPELALERTVNALPESDIRISLLQGLVKSDAMDLIVQKATELGVDAIYAVKTGYSVVRLDGDRRARRLAHWQRIAVSACEQSGRHRPPTIEIVDELWRAIEQLPPAGRIALTAGAGAAITAADTEGDGVAIAIGPEGGFTPEEIDVMARSGFSIRSLGPRTLRAETAAIAACTSAQLLWGDLGR